MDIDQFTIYLLLLLVAHWIGDFVLQTDDMAARKSRDLDALIMHVVVYSMPLLAWKIGVIMFAHPHMLFWWFYPVNVVLHFGIDYYTSRWTSRLRAEGRMHQFFVVIGFDQLLHAVVLVMSLRLLMFT